MPLSFSYDFFFWKIECTYFSLSFAFPTSHKSNMIATTLLNAHTLFFSYILYLINSGPLWRVSFRSKQFYVWNKLYPQTPIISILPHHIYICIYNYLVTYSYLVEHKWSNMLIVACTQQTDWLKDSHTRVAKAAKPWLWSVYWEFDCRSF